MTYVDSKGRRVSTERAYLTSEVRNRSNFRVITNALVTKVIIEDVDGTKKAVGVEYSANGALGERMRINVRREVVLW